MEIFLPQRPLQPHCTNSSTAKGAGGCVHLFGTYKPLSRSHPFSSMGGKYDVDDDKIYLLLRYTLPVEDVE